MSNEDQKVKYVAIKNRTKKKLETFEEYLKLRRALVKINADGWDIIRNISNEFAPYNMIANPEKIIRHLDDARTEAFYLLTDIFDEVSEEIREETQKMVSEEIREETRKREERRKGGAK